MLNIEVLTVVNLKRYIVPGDLEWVWIHCRAGIHNWPYLWRHQLKLRLKDDKLPINLSCFITLLLCDFFRASNSVKRIYLHLFTTAPVALVSLCELILYIGERWMIDVTLESRDNR